MKADDKSHCKECGAFILTKNILPSGLCSRCSKNLAALFSFKPQVATEEIRSIQSAEGNTPCFNTGEKNGCGQGHCEWQNIYD